MKKSATKSRKIVLPPNKPLPESVRAIIVKDRWNGVNTLTKDFWRKVRELVEKDKQS